MIDYANKVDWDLFKRQKQMLVEMTFDQSRPVEETDLLEGVVCLLDALQDSFQPYDLDEDEG